MEDHSRTYDLGAAAAIVGRRLPLIAALTIVAALVALALSLAQDDVYTAETTMLSRDQGLDDRISRTPVLKFETDDSLGTATNAGLADLDEVAAATGAKLGLTRTEVRDDVSVETDPEASLIVLEADAGTPEEAAELADTFAQTFIALRREDDIRAARDALRGLKAAYEKADDRGDSSQELKALETQMRQVEIYGALQTGNVEQVERAEVPTSTSSPRTLINVVAGGLAGLLIGIGAALISDRVRPRFRSRRDAEGAFGAPVLAEIPADGERGREDGLRTLRTRLLHPAAGSPPRIVLVIAVDDDAAAAAVGAGLAGVSAAGGVPSALVETDMSRGSVAGSEHDLAGVLAGRSRPAEAIERGVGGTPSRVTAGASGDAAALLSGPHLRTLLDELRRDHELIVITARSPLRAPDAVPLARLAEAVVIVADADAGKRSQATTLRERLGALGVEPAGVALVGRRAQPG